jgi:hypothetical protein
MVAIGQLDPGPDGIGIYADLEGTQASMMAEPGMVELHVLATGLSEPGGIGGWEMSLYFDGPVTYLGYLIPYNHINVGIFPSFSVGAGGDIRPQAPVIHLMTMTFLVTGTDPADFYIRAAHLPEGGSLGNDLPVYADGANFSHLVNLFPSSGSVELPVFSINGEQPVATEPVSFGGIKALYR